MSSPNLHGALQILQGMGLGLCAMLIHETAHVLTAIALGVDVKRVGLGWKGIYTVRAPGTPGKNLIISLAGPLTNLVLLLLWHLSPTFGMANICMGAVNLLPIEGSDGLRILRCWQKLREKSVPVS